MADKASLVWAEKGLLIVCDPQGEYPGGAAQELTPDVAGVLAIGPQIPADWDPQFPAVVEGRVVMAMLLSARKCQVSEWLIVGSRVS